MQKITNFCFWIKMQNMDFYNHCPPPKGIYNKSTCYDLKGQNIMAIEFAIQKWGNSAAIRLPAPVLAQLNLHLSDKVTAKLCNEGLMLMPIKNSTP